MGGAFTQMLGLNPASVGPIAYLQSVQYGSITLGNGVASNTATITSVNTSLAYVVFLGQTWDTSTTNNKEWASVVLTNGTTVTAQRGASGTNSVTVNFMVIEGTSSLIDTVQAGTVSISASTSGTATITSVDLTRSMIIYSGSNLSSTGTVPTAASAGITLTNATTVTATVGASSTVTVYYVVVQFKAAAIQSVQQRAIVSTATTTTQADTITSINTANTLLFWGGISTTTSTWAVFSVYAQLTSSTNVNLVRTGTAATSRTYNYTVVEFVSGVITSMQRSTTSVASATSATSTITSVNTTKAVANFNGFNCTGTVYGEIEADMTLTNATTITAKKGIAGATTSIVGWEVAEFN